MKRTGIVEKRAAKGISNRMNQRLLTLKQAADYLGLTTWAMRERVWNGDIPVVRFSNGRKQYIDVQDIEAFIKANKERIA